MNKLILFTLLLILSINTLSFAQETNKPEKKRNWMVGIGIGPGIHANPRFAVSTYFHFNYTVGYKGFNVACNQTTNFLPEKDGLHVYHWTVGYQHVYSKKSNAKVKAIFGFNYGPWAYNFDSGIRYKRSQFLFTMGRAFPTTPGPATPWLFPFQYLVEGGGTKAGDRLISTFFIKYQFLF